MNFHQNEVFQDPIESQDVLNEDNVEHMLQVFDQYEYDALLV